MNQVRKKSGKKIILLIAVIIVVVSLILVFRYNQKVNYESSFGELIRQGEYDEALKLYRDVQYKATDISLNQATRQRYGDIQKSYENYVKEKTDAILARLEKGDNLTVNDQSFIVGMAEVSGAIIAPELNRVTEQWIDNKIEHTRWKHIIKSFEGYPNLKTSIDNLLSQEDELTVAAQKFKENDALPVRENWNLIWRNWQNLTLDEEIGRFARNYAEYRLKIFQEDIYSLLMDEVNLYMSGNKYYSAVLILDRLFDAFPNETEIQEKLQICNEKLPDNLVVWEDLVENIAVRPLVVDPKTAKDGPYKQYAETGLLTTGEFESLLMELYKNDYVLVSSGLFNDYPEDFSNVVVPKGKKPLILIFEQYQYSVAHLESGTAAQLVYDQAEDRFLSRMEANKRETEVKYADAVTILEKFLQEHSDFSFDGAKALIALNTDENVLGYTINEEQTQNIIQKRANLELEPYILTDKSEAQKVQFYNLQMAELRTLLQALQNHGYFFANATYSGAMLNTLSYEDFEAEITKWESIMHPFIGSVDALLYPSGSHVYDQAEKIEFILDSGYCNFYSESPSIYNFYAEDYIHFDYVAFNGNSLSNSESRGLSRFVDVDQVMEDWRD